jgi:hypothetical protein
MSDDGSLNGRNLVKLPNRIKYSRFISDLVKVSGSKRLAS